MPSLPDTRLWEGAVKAAGFYTLAILAPVLLLSGSESVRLALPAAPIYLILAHASARIALIAAGREPRIVSLTFWVFVYIFLGICPLLQVALKTFPLAGSYEERVLVHAALIVLAGLWAFEAGQRIAKWRQRPVGVPGILLRPVKKTAIVLAGVAALLLSVLLLQRLGGLEALFLPRVQRAEVLADKFSGPELLLFIHLARSPVYAVLMAALTVWVFAGRHGNPAAGGAWKALCAVLLLVALVVNNPISTPRLTVGTIFLSLFFILPWQRAHGLLAAGGLVAGLIFVFPLADLFRVSLDASLAEHWKAMSAARELAQTMDFDSFQQVANTVVFVEREGLQWGRQILGAVLFWFPRSLWPTKPISTGEFIGEQSGYAYTNLSSPLWAELYVDGGLLLVVCAFVAYGALVRTLDLWHASGGIHGRATVLSVLIPVYAGYQFFLLRGSLMSAFAYFAPILIFAWLCSLRMPARAGPSMRSTASGDYTCTS